MQNRRDDRKQETDASRMNNSGESNVTEMRDTQEQRGPGERGKKPGNKGAGREHGERHSERERHSQKDWSGGAPSRQTSTASEEKGQL